MKSANAEEEIAFIKQTIADSKRLLSDKGYFYILWGCVAVIGIFLKYLLEFLNLNIASLLLWGLLLLLGWLFTFILQRRLYRKVRSKTFAERIFAATWRAILIAIIILSLIGYYTNSIESYAVAGVIAALLGCGYFISGVLSETSWIKTASYIWWLFSIIIFLFPGNYSVALLGGLIIILQLIPGLIMIRNWKIAAVTHK